MPLIFLRKCSGAGSSKSPRSLETSGTIGKQGHRAKVKLPASPTLPVLLLAAGTTPAGRLLLLCPASTPPPCSLLRKGSFSKPWQIPWAGAHRAPATVPKNAAVPLQGHAGRSPAPAPAPSLQQGDGLQFSSATAKTKVTARGNCKQLLPTGPGRISAGVTGGVNFLRSLHAGSLTGKGI